MKTMRNIKIMIKQVENKQGEYIAYFRSDLLNATYCIYFRDDIMGFVAFHNFAEMIKSKYEGTRIDFVVSDEKIEFKSKAMLEAMSRGKV